METLRSVMEIVALAAASTLCVYLIIVLARVKSVLEFIDQDLRKISEKAAPILENLAVITARVKDVAETISDQVDAVKLSIASLKEVADNIVAFERRVQEILEEPVTHTVESIAALFRMVQGFIDRLPFSSRLRAEKVS